jgi:hypothetical protein
MDDWNLDWSHSWYRPGDWALPTWWTEGPPLRDAGTATYQEQEAFYNSKFVRENLGYTGGMTGLPRSDGK